VFLVARSGTIDVVGELKGLYVCRQGDDCEWGIQCLSVRQAGVRRGRAVLFSPFVLLISNETRGMMMMVMFE